MIYIFIFYYILYYVIYIIYLNKLMIYNSYVIYIIYLSLLWHLYYAHQIKIRQHTMMLLKMTPPVPTIWILSVSLFSQANTKLTLRKRWNGIEFSDREISSPHSVHLFIVESPLVSIPDEDYLYLEYGNKV